jgi:acetyltransferase-like isoleucine patch superfamily enzyme
MGKYVREVIRHAFSLRFLVSLIYSFAYYIHEHVVWRASVHAERDVRIHATASIRNAQNVHVGKNSHINHMCCVWAGENSKIIMGDNLLMGPGVCMFSSNHSMSDGQPMSFQERKEASIVIGDDVWLGALSVITAGTHIADGVVVAAGAVVTRSITRERVIVAGIPAKIIGQRPSAPVLNINDLETMETASVLPLVK